MPSVINEEPQVLIIDDLAEARALLRDMLEEMGFRTIVEAKNAEEAFAALKRHGAQLILCDQMMHGMSGTSFVKKINDYALLRDIPVVMISSCSDDFVIDEALQSGARDYVQKPLNFKLLRSKLGSLVGSWVERS